MGTPRSVKRVSAKELRTDSLPRGTRHAFLRCTKTALFSRGDWYLAGGTALALQVGHRQSVDLDFFTLRSTFRNTALERSLLAEGQWRTDYQEPGTVFGTFAEAKMSFIAYPFFRPSHSMLRCGYVRILAPEDIAAMKIVAVSQRGRKRDFVDLYWYCKHREPLDLVILRAVRQYPGQQENINHFLKSLVYFADAEGDPMPRLNFSASWKQIKVFFQREVPNVARKLLGLPR